MGLMVSPAGHGSTSARTTEAVPVYREAVSGSLCGLASRPVLKIVGRYSCARDLRADFQHSKKLRSFYTGRYV
jgi:hypothetical protein